MTALASSEPAHPRSRGEHGEKLAQCWPPFGSSPLARGTSTPQPHPRTPSRLIPARAGNMLMLFWKMEKSSAHPRSRGEHINDRGDLICPPGSSPLARGTFLSEVWCVGCFRLIPARAGNMQNASASVKGTAAHPRSRGEHDVRACAAGGWRGSSPLARGTSCLGHLREALSRLIPARAGNIRPTF